jgi:hypothetical protein
MAAFTDDVYLLQDRLDWSIFQNGWSSLYHDTDILEKDIGWFKRVGYTVVDMHCSGWNNHQAMHHMLKATLNFPAYYGENLNALNDC